MTQRSHEPAEKNTGGFGGMFDMLAPMRSKFALGEYRSVWKETKDPATGNTYWYNSETGETTWKDPAVDSGLGRQGCSGGGRVVCHGIGGGFAV